MKIGIVTFHSALNSGAVLQAFALQTYLKRMGHEVELINLKRKRKRIVRDFIGKSLVKTYRKWLNLYNSIYYSRNYRFGNVLERGKQFYKNEKELKKNPPEYDVYIAGSDQIWNVGSTGVLYKPYFLDFGSSSIKRIAYAASLGQGDIPKKFEEEMRALLLNFDAISIRESNGCDIIRSLVGDQKEIYHVADPTLLLKAEDYQKISKDISPNSGEQYIASYILSHLENGQVQILDYLRMKLGTRILNLRNPDTCIFLNNAKNVVVDPGEWLTNMKNAKLVICFSFHGVVFSLLFHKPFLVLSPYENQRILSLLKPLGLENHCVTDFREEEIDQILEDKIDWNLVDQIIAKDREISEQFLLDALNS